MYTIEKNVPLVKRKVLKRDFPFDQMEVGDSFVVSGNKQELSRIRVAMYVQVNKLPGKKVATRRVEGGMRVWLTERN